MNFLTWLIIASVGFDLLVGDPKSFLHPVQVMGNVITFLRVSVEFLAKENVLGLKIGGLGITLILIIFSGMSGWILEQLLIKRSFFPTPISSIAIVIALSSAIASGSLRKSVLEVLSLLPKDENDQNLGKAKLSLSKIVGRDVKSLDRIGILRATAETASENAVDGIFGPIFWMFIGSFLMQQYSSAPGPLALAWIFKASSTLDSMIGYKYGRFKWLGYSGARLDDLLTYIPCRLVLISLPLVSQSWKFIPQIIKSAWIDGSKDNSPNSGLSEAIFAYCANIKMGGENLYKGTIIFKPLIAINEPEASITSIKKILNLILRLQLLWVGLFASIYLISSILLYQ